MRSSGLLMMNTMIMTATGFLMRTIAVAFNVYLTNRIGSAGIGLFQLILAVYALAVTFASAGIKLASTRLITDSLSGKDGVVKDIMRCCIRYGLTLGSIIAIALYLSAEIISKRWVFDERAKMPLQILALSLPPIAMSAALSGYFTARKTIAKYSAVQLCEQLTKIIVTVIALKILSTGNLAYACAAITIGISASECVSFSLSTGAYLSDKMRLHSARGTFEPFRGLMRIAVPDAVGSWVRSILLTVEHLLIPVGFRKSGADSQKALEVYGTIHGMAPPVILYPSALLTSLASMLVPEIAELQNRKDSVKVNSLINRILHLTALFAIGTAAVMFAFSSQLSGAIYENTDAAFFIKLLSVLLPFMYLDMIVDGMLKGLDEQVATMRYNIIDSFLCVVLVYYLLPKYSVKGYIFILFISELINFALSLNRLITVAKVTLNPMRDLAKPLFCAVGTVSVVRIFAVLLGIGSGSSKPLLIFLIGFSAVLYCVFLYAFDSLDKEELRWLRRVFSFSGGYFAHRRKKADGRRAKADFGT